MNTENIITIGVRRINERKPKKKTLVLDLDETLIHSRRDGNYKRKYKTNPKPDFTFSVSFVSIF